MMHMFKRHNEKILIGFIIGFLVSSIVVVYAATYLGTGSELTYNNASSGLSSTNVQDALDELYRKKDRCPTGYACFIKKTSLALGDYVSYTPSLTTYSATFTETPSRDYGTGSINFSPSELNLWRVIKINNDGSVDIVSEYTSSKTMFFGGLNGFINYVGLLNHLASQYENSAYTSGSRYFGYNGQTEYITDTSMITYPPPWTCNTGYSCHPETYESQGGGDLLGEYDLNLIQVALGTLTAYKVGTTTPAAYWVASRHYNYDGAYFYGLRRVLSSGEYGIHQSYSYNETQSSFLTSTQSGYLRPIVTLKPGLSYWGIGTKDYPMEIQ